MTRSAAPRRLYNFPMAYSIFMNAGVGDYIDIPLETLNPNTNDFSLEIRARVNMLPKDYTPSFDMNFYSQNNGTGTGRSWLFIDRLTNKLSTFINGSGNVTNFIVPQGQWVHYVMTYRTSGTTMNIYANGAVVGVFTITPTSADGGHRIGQNKSNTGRTYANFALNRLWSRELSSSEVQDLYYANTSTNTSLRYQLLYTDGSGTQVTDSSGNNKNGTLTGGSWSTEVPSSLRSTATGRSAAPTRSPS